MDDSELDEEGGCPTCGTVLTGPHRVPWHFRVLVVATAIYLLYRLVQGLMWLAHHI
ncbi:MAG TPA: hypothetical protein VFA11_09505 [Acidimicrobiales bacterium]|nr:hypothetical protein [Acidimicrobiales bacterium]